jgi:phage shock protein PspC (stress-responsive transcriptional regulator)
MNKVITINLNGNAYQLEEDGYEALRAYLDAAGRRLSGNPDRDEIIADIEQSIADKFRSLLGANKSVVVTKEVKDVIAEMGPVQDAGEPGPEGAPQAGAATGAAPASPGAQAGAQAPKRLYRIRDGAKIGGVCNGLAAYFDIDVTLVRIIFGALGLLWGAGILFYFVLMFALPVAETPAEKAAASGIPSTAEDFVRRAREGYYEGMRTFSDRKAYREWKRNFKQEMRQRSRAFKWEMQGAFGPWWGPVPPNPPAAYHFLKLVCFAVTVLFIVMLVSLVTHGFVYGLLMPAGVPTWIGVVFLILIYKIVKFPIRAMTHGYWGWGCGLGFLPCLLNVFLWIASVYFLIWILNHHYHGMHEVLDGFRQVAHQAVDSVRDWWDGR